MRACLPLLVAAALLGLLLFCSRDTTPDWKRLPNRDKEAVVKHHPTFLFAPWE